MEGQLTKYNFTQLINDSLSKFGVRDQLPRFLAVGLLGVGVDCISFYFILHLFTSDVLTAQVFSFVVAVTHNFTLNRYWTFKVRGYPDTPGQYLKFFLVALVALGLRSGVIANCLRFGFSPFLSLMAGIGSGTAINFIGSREWAFSQNKNSGSITSNGLIWAFIVFLFLVRLVYAAIIDLSPEEAYYWNYAMHPALSYYDHPPMVAWVIRMGTLFFGHTELGVRIGGIVFAIGSTYFIYLLGKLWFAKRSGLVAALLFQVIPIYFIYGFTATPDSPLIFFWLFTMYVISITLQQDRNSGWYVAGFTLGCAMLSKYPGIILVPSTFLFLFLNRVYRKWLIKKEPYIALFIAFLVVSPVLVWNYHHNWASFDFQFSQRFSHNITHPILSFLEFFGGQMGVVFPSFSLGLLLVLGMCFQLSIKTLDPKWKLSFCFCLPLLVILIFSSFKSETKVNWALPGYLSLLIASYPCYRYFRFRIGKTFKAKIQKTLEISIYSMPVVFLLIFYHLSIGIPFLPVITKLEGWRQLGKAIEKEEAAMERGTGNDPFLIGLSKYYIAAELAFYTDEPYDTFSLNLLGGKSLAFEYWTNKKNLQTRDALVISREFPNIHFLEHFFARVDKKVSPIVITRQGHIIQCYYLTRCYHYTG